jgi:hypothetical protein
MAGGGHSLSHIECRVVQTRPGGQDHLDWHSDTHDNISLLGITMPAANRRNNCGLATNYPPPRPRCGKVGHCQRIAVEAENACDVLALGFDHVLTRALRDRFEPQRDLICCRRVKARLRRELIHRSIKTHREWVTTVPRFGRLAGSSGFGPRQTGGKSRTVSRDQSQI